MEAELDGVIGAIYEAAGSPERWPETLDRITDALGGTQAQLFVRDKRVEVPLFSAVTTRHPPDADREYHAYYGRIDPRVPIGLSHPPGYLVLCHEHLDDDFVRRDEFYNDFFMRHGLRYLAAQVLLDTPQHLAIVGFHRSQRQGPFSGTAGSPLVRIMDHLGRAVRLNVKLAAATAEADAAAAVLDRLTFGVALVATTGKVVGINRRAQDLIAADDGVRLVGGALVASTGPFDERDQLTRAVAEAAAVAAGRPGEPSAAFRVARPSGKPAWIVLVGPLFPTSPLVDGVWQPLALVMLIDPEDRAAPRGATLSTLFGLSRAEAELACALLEGNHLEDIADLRGVRISTLRSQLSSVLAKTETSRQVDLIRLLARLPTL